jgi:hypothetical protein
MDATQYADVAVDASKTSRAETVLNTETMPTDLPMLHCREMVR